jgi:hypothetical protein
VGVRRGRNETGRREEENVKEPHCYCMMDGRVSNACNTRKGCTLGLFARPAHRYESKQAVPDLNRESAPF